MLYSSTAPATILVKLGSPYRVETMCTHIGANIIGLLALYPSRIMLDLSIVCCVNCILRRPIQPSLC